MNKVYKYHIPFLDEPYQEFEIDMPATSTILNITEQYDSHFLYAKVNLGSLNKKRYFFLVWTGIEIKCIYQHEYINTFVDTYGLVYHLFEILH